MANSWEKANALLHEYDNLSSAIRILDQELPYRVVLLAVTVIAALVAVSAQSGPVPKIPAVVFVILMLLLLAIVLTIAYLRIQACTSYRRMKDIELQVNSLLGQDLLQIESCAKPNFNKRTQRSLLGVGVWYYLLWAALSSVGYFTSAYGLSRSVPAG